MRIRQIAVSALFAAGLAALPLATAEAQYYYPPCSPFPLAWPFCIAGAAVNTAAAIVTAPFAALSGPYYYPYYGSTATAMAITVGRGAITRGGITRIIITERAEPAPAGRDFARHCGRISCPATRGDV